MASPLLSYVGVRLDGSSKWSWAGSGRLRRDFAVIAARRAGRSLRGLPPRFWSENKFPFAIWFAVKL